jgi:glycosyltransferase involved in cell wall biosynthesis
MKKVLIIANLFHASPRIPGLAKYLPEFEWEPIILTVPIGEKPDVLPNAKAVEVPYHDALRDLIDFQKKLLWKRLFGISPNESIGRHVEKQFGITSKKSFVDSLYNLYKAIIHYPDSERCWKSFAVKVGSELVQKGDIDAIISSSSPVTSHLIAKELKKRHKIPWVADLRDLWTQNHNYGYGTLRKQIDRRLELKTLLPADTLVTVSPPLARKLKRLHRGKTTNTITNGFDPAEMKKEHAGLTSKFTITYTGQIYTGKQDPSKLFAALQNLIAEGNVNPNDVEVEFYGTEYRSLTDDIKKYELSDIVTIHGRIPRQIAFEKQRASQLLLLLNWEEPQECGVYSLKVFEYLAARRPILATGGSCDDVVKALLAETKAGMYAPTVEDIKRILRELYSEYKCKGEISYNGDVEEINKYSYREMARKFAEILDSIARE